MRTYTPGDICLHNVGTMSALCPHNISLVRHISFVRYDVVRTLCRHYADIYLQGYMSAQCPHYILLWFSGLKSRKRLLQITFPFIHVLTLCPYMYIDIIVSPLSACHSLDEALVDSWSRLGFPFFFKIGVRKIFQIFSSVNKV